MDTARLEEEYGLSEAVVDEIRARDQRQLELFLKLTGGSAAVLWLFLTVSVYARSFGSAPVLGLLVAPLLALLGAVIGALPIALVCGVGVLVLCPRHPMAGTLERHQAAHSRTRPCGRVHPRPGRPRPAAGGRLLCPLRRLALSGLPRSLRPARDRRPQGRSRPRRPPRAGIGSLVPPRGLRPRAGTRPSGGDDRAPFCGLHLTSQVSRRSRSTSRRCGSGRRPTEVFAPSLAPVGLRAAGRRTRRGERGRG